MRSAGCLGPQAFTCRTAFVDQSAPAATGRQALWRRRGLTKLARRPASLLQVGRRLARPATRIFLPFAQVCLRFRLRLRLHLRSRSR